MCGSNLPSQVDQEQYGLISNWTTIPSIVVASWLAGELELFSLTIPSSTLKSEVIVM